jgi:hypothetical protein
MNRPDILAAATQAVTKDRAATHGPVAEQLAKVAAIWSAQIGVTIRPDQVALMMVELKVVRAWHNPNHVDNWVDIAGWGACGGEIGTETAVAAPPAPVAHVASTHAAPDTERGSTGRSEGCAHV